MYKRSNSFQQMNHLLKKHRHRLATIAITLVALISMLVFSLVYYPSGEFSEEPGFEVEQQPFATESASTSETTITAHKEAEIPIAAPAPDNYARVILEDNETLSQVFNRLQLPQKDLLQIIKLPQAKNAIRRLQSGQALEFLVSETNKLDTLILPLNASEDLKITRQENQFSENIVKHDFNVSSKLLTATVHSSLYLAGEKADIPRKIMVSFTTIFGWQFNFSRDVRDGDKLTILFQEMQDLKSHKIEPGDIIAAKFTHGTQTYYAYQYRDAQGRVSYYDENGNSLRKAFRRNPLNTGHISSPFNLHRRHPILGYVRPHLGTDFAAPYGTPIYATGDGRILFEGRKGGYGRCIVIDHGNGITSLYGHMSRFNTKYKQGSYVKMNDVIGYIGCSGLCEGPHVHYEYRVDKRYLDPMKVKLPNGAPVPKKEKQAYTDFVTQTKSKLDGLAETSTLTSAITSTSPLESSSASKNTSTNKIKIA